jgi:hypothetical protein
MEILERDIATKTTEYMFSMVFSNLDKHQPWSLGITIMRTGPGKHHTFSPLSGGEITRHPNMGETQSCTPARLASSSHS